MEDLKLETKPKPIQNIVRSEQAWEGFVFSLSQLIIRTLGRVFMFFMARIRVRKLEGWQNSHKPLIVISNHKSYYDPLVIACSFPVTSKVYPLRFIAKDEFFTNLISTFIFWAMGAFPTYSGQGLDKSLAKPEHVLTNGGAVMFFPEGQCYREENLGAPKIGAAMLALRHPQAQIIPMAIHNSYKIGHAFRPVIKTTIGQPFYLKDKIAVTSTPEQISEMFMREISNLYETIH